MKVSQRARRRAPQVVAPTPFELERGASASREHAQERTQTPDFDRLYNEYFHHVSRWARALGGLDADLDDLTQEVFLVVRRKLEQFDGPSVRPWLYGITRKTVSDYRRRAWSRRLLKGLTRSLHTAAEPAAQVDTHERWEARRTVQQVLGRMSPIRRSAFVLFEIEGYRGEEIAELEQVPVATVYTRLHHARKDFLRLLEELTDEPPRGPST